MGDSTALPPKNLIVGLAGLVAAVASTILLYPLDQLGAVLQADGFSRGQASAGTLSTLLNLLQSSDTAFGGVLRGLSSQLQSTGISYFIYFWAYNSLKFSLSSLRIGRWTLPQSVSDLCAASIAGALGVLLTSPFWVASTRIRLGTATGHGLLAEVVHIGTHEGTGALWNGLSSSLVLVANPTIQFMLYDLIKRRVFLIGVPGSSQSSLGARQAFLTGAGAKCVASVVTYPFQVAQTRQRMYQRSSPGSNSMGVIACLTELLWTGGPRALFAGIEAKLLQMVISAALMFVFYEKLTVLLTRGYIGIVNSFEKFSANSQRPEFQISVDEQPVSKTLAGEQELKTCTRRTELVTRKLSDHETSSVAGG